MLHLGIAFFIIEIVLQATIFLYKVYDIDKIFKYNNLFHKAMLAHISVEHGNLSITIYMYHFARFT